VNTYDEFLLLGLGNGGVFAALAMALVVTYHSSGVLNFATGAQALYAAYTYSRSGPSDRAGGGAARSTQ
jgi:branched-subunit amino acid ABC-type transport system permease component